MKYPRAPSPRTPRLYPELSLEGDVGNELIDVPGRVRVGLTGHRLALHRQAAEVNAADVHGRCFSVDVDELLDVGRDVREEDVLDRGGVGSGPEGRRSVRFHVDELLVRGLDPDVLERGV